MTIWQKGGMVIPMLFLSTVSLRAGDFWESKPPAQWSAAEIARILAHSPWAKRARVTLLTNPQPPSAESPFPPPGLVPETGRGIPSGEGVSSDVSGVPRPQLRIVIRWQSALPVKQALQRLGNGTMADAADRNAYYVVAAVGFPPPDT